VLPHQGPALPELRPRPQEDVEVVVAAGVAAPFRR
jgi:hypothetical protein